VKPRVLLTGRDQWKSRSRSSVTHRSKWNYEYCRMGEESFDAGRLTDMTSNTISIDIYRVNVLKLR
jgi:hypothetical protein